MLNYIQRHDLVVAAAARGAELSAALHRVADKHETFGDVRGIGMLQGIELVRDKASREPFPSADAVAHQLGRACIAEGLAIYPGQGGADGQSGDHALVTPPLTITSEQIEDLAARLDRALTYVEARL